MQGILNSFIDRNEKNSKIAKKKQQKNIKIIILKANVCENATFLSEI